MLTSRSFKVTVPTASTDEDTVRFSANATRRPSDCRACGEMLRPGWACASPSSAYLGTSCMSMNGDLPGLSNFCVGCIGSYQ